MTLPRTAETEKHAIRSLVDDTGVQKVSDVTPLLTEDYKARRFGQVSLRTVNIEIGAAKTMLNREGQVGLIPENPIGTVGKMKGPSQKRIEFLAEEQVVALLANSSATYRPILYTYLTGGMPPKRWSTSNGPI